MTLDVALLAAYLLFCSRDDGYDRRGALALRLYFQIFALLVFLSWIACRRFIGGPSSRRRPLSVTVPKFALSTDELSGTPPKAIV